MHAQLIEQWERGMDLVPVIGPGSLSEIASRVRELAQDAGLDPSPDGVTTRALALAEAIASNVLRHALAGSVAVHRIERAAPGIEVVGVDRGPGWLDLRSAVRAIHGGASVIRSLATELDIDVRVGEGTRVAARVFDPAEARGREVGVYGRPLPGEPVSGDHAAVRRLPGGLVVAVCDGLGHGTQARIASARAADVFLARAEASLPAILTEMHDALRTTRGAVVALARVDDLAGTVEVATTGNVDVRIATPGEPGRRFLGNAAVVGSGPPRIRTETAPFPRDSVLVISTDGIPAGTRIEDELGLGLFQDWAAVIAESLVERCARTTDDALVLVVR